MTTPPRNYADIGGLKIAQVIAGEGAAVIVLHGWGANIDLVRPLVDQLAARDFKVFALDLPGFGNSVLPPRTWSVLDYANFVAAFLDYHHLERVHLIGHSFGGRLGLILGAEYPERIGKLALLDSAGVRPRPSLQSKARLATYKIARDGLRMIRLGMVADKVGAWYSNRYGSADYKNAGALREIFVKVVNEDLLPYAARIQAPTLLMWGELDEGTPLWQGKLLEKTIPDAGLVVLQGAGHYSYLDKLAETVRILDYFFKHDE